MFSLSPRLKIHIPSFKKINKYGPDTREAPCMPCQNSFHWQTRDSSFGYHLFQPSHGVTSLDFPTRSSVAPKFYVVHQKSQMQVVFKTLHTETQKTIWGNSLLTLHRLLHFLRMMIHGGMITAKEACPMLGRRRPSNSPAFNSCVCSAPVLWCAQPFVKCDVISWPPAFPIWEPESLGTDHG